MNSTERLAQLLADVTLAGTDVPDEQITLVATLLAEKFRVRFGQPHLPQPRESVAVTLERPKTAALVFDRVWSPPVFVERAPDDIGMYGATEAEIWSQAASLLAPKIRDWERFGAEVATSPIAQFWRRGITSPVRFVSEALFNDANVLATPLYASSDGRDSDYIAGDTETIVTVISDVAVPDEERLSWEQVREFRNDVEMRRAYRQFLYWLNAEMAGRPRQFIIDQLNERVETYQMALRKHGIETCVGSVEALIDPKFVGGTAALFAGLSFAADVTVGGVVTVALCAGKAACSLARHLTNREELKRTHSKEVAFVCNLRRSVEDAG